MEGVRGYTWATFEEKAREIESLSGWPPSRKPLSPNAGRLCREDMAMYGEEPAIDSLSLVVCGQCGRVIKSQALLQHIKHCHTDMVNIPVPHSVAPPPLGGVHTIGQPSSAMSTSDSSSGYHSAGGGAGVTGFTASQLPTSSGGSGRSNKEYDPNKHCGVWISDSQRYCTHSLTCKEHPVSERRKVMGRSRTFDDLLDEHKKKKKMRKLEKLKSDADMYLNQQSSTSHAHSPPLRSPTRSSRFEPTSPGSEGTGGGGGGTGVGGGEATRTSAPTTPLYPRSTDHDDFPRPLAVCSFGGRSQLGGGLLRFSRKQDNLRSALAHLSGRSQDYTQTTLHRKHSYNSLLQQKRLQRKYFKPQQQVQVSEESTSHHRPSSLPLPLHPKPLPPTTPSSSQPTGLTSPPLYASNILLDISSGTPTSLPLTVGGSASSQENPIPPPQPPPTQTPVSTPQRAPSVSGTMVTPESMLNLGLSNGDISRESMDTDLETPLSAPHVAEMSLNLNPPPSTAAPAQASNKRSGKKKKKRGRKPKDKTQVVDNSTAVSNSTQGTTPVESGGQQSVVDQNSRTPVGGTVVGGVLGHHLGDDALRTSREQMEVERRRSIGSSSSISMPPALHLNSNPHHLLNNSYSGVSGSGNQGHPVSESGQSRLTDHHHRAPSAPSETTTPSRESAGVGLPLPLGPGGVVRVKQEPITNDEEEMETNQPPHLHQRQPTTKPQSVVLNGMVTPPSGSGSPSLHPSFGSQTFVINPTGQHSSPGGHPLMTSLSPHMGGLLPIRGSPLFSTSSGLITTAHQLQMMQQQRTVLLQQLRQQQQQQQQMMQAAAAVGGGGGGSLSSPQSSMSIGSTSRTNANPMQNSISTGGGLVMTASGHGFQHGFQGGSTSVGGVNRIRAPISHIPSGNPAAAFQEVRTMPRLNALSQSTNKSLLHQSKQSLNSGTGTPRPHSQQVT